MRRVVELPDGRVGYGRVRSGDPQRMREGLVELVVSAAAAAASFLDVVDVAVDRLPVVAGHETPAGESCKTEQVVGTALVVPWV